jgi:hypothetical protein
VGECAAVSYIKSTGLEVAMPALRSLEKHPADVTFSSCMELPRFQQLLKDLPKSSVRFAARRRSPWARQVPWTEGVPRPAPSRHRSVGSSRRADLKASGLKTRCRCREGDAGRGRFFTRQPSNPSAIKLFLRASDASLELSCRPLGVIGTISARQACVCAASRDQRFKLCPELVSAYAVNVLKLAALNRGSS